ncbi:RagB/SusD family nutrient uptake outer membrane protein [Maribacter sp. TH_r10]|uniref:RagB/SusD family nutrient uptake outer membrane protein n=1 Tax=Maribacter luteus TaxID=2594478 RepID=A0A6I2MQU4_9FLAO|nr:MULTISPECIES: RagB/SusD family nutrient uptake outer membrane protein [Maribacter]MDV7139068.1 RagB/SusD family nutrient uptake outer membrane protein [Maribacter sp. TH_r10]MRX64820.1 RagB/SusD family nutrient uptake outer membrane protein [Maribacter luteus]
MKTKNIFIYTFILFSFLSCEKFLEEEPRAIVAPETFFASENDARQAIQGTYAILKNNSIYGQVGLDHFYDNGADIIEPNRSANFVEPIGNYSLNEALADVSVQKMSVSDTWKDLYRVIFNTNIIIDRVSGNEALLQEARTEIIAEATFLRALCYWHITNLWGAAPYYNEVLTLEEVGQLGRTDEATIINGILSDLQFAQANLPDSYPEAQRGRASKWAAAIIEAKIYMKQESWEAGLAKCLEIINESPHMLLPTYNEVFDPLNEYNAEIIWSLDFAKDIEGIFDPAFPGAAFAGNNSWRPSMFNPRLRDEPKNTDERGALRDALSANGQAFNGTGLQVASKDFAEKFPLNDLRRELNIVDNYLGFDLNFPYMAKFWNLDLETSPRFNHSDNRMVFRLADVHLMAAECENERPGGDPTVAYGYIKEIRERAFATIEEAEAIKGLSQQEFREAIYDERKWELAGEAHRRYDLIRWGILLDVVQNLEYRFWEPNVNIKPYHVLLPIPLQELEQNPALLDSDPTNNGYR